MEYNYGIKRFRVSLPKRLDCMLSKAKSKLTPNKDSFPSGKHLFTTLYQMASKINLIASLIAGRLIFRHFPVLIDKIFNPSGPSSYKSGSTSLILNQLFL
jgi:hypothetical protein